MRNLKLSKGYVVAYAPSHPRAASSGYVPEHIRIAERALGRFIAEPIQIHHVNRVKTDNRNANLVICQDDEYHKLLHLREDAFIASGHPEWRKCCYCKRYDSTSRMKVHAHGKFGRYHHKDCATDYRRKRKRQRSVISGTRKEQAE